MNSFFNDENVMIALNNLRSNPDFGYLLSSLNNYHNELTRSLINADSPEVRGILKLFIQPFLEACGKAEFYNLSVIEKARIKAKNQWELDQSGQQYIDQEL